MKTLITITLLTLLLCGQGFADTTTHCEADPFGNGFDCTTTDN